MCINELVAKDDIKELWQHPSVRALIKKRRLRLDDSAELYVILCASASTCLSVFSFLNSIDRIGTVDYLPSTGECGATLYVLVVSELCIQTISCGRGYRQWALRSMSSRFLWVPRLSSGFCMTLVERVVKCVVQFHGPSCFSS